MKKIYILLLSLFTILSSCSKDDNSETSQDSSSPVTAVVDGEFSTYSNAFNNNEAINSFFSKNAVYYEAWKGKLSASDIITISIQRQDLKVGTYLIGENSVFQDITHIGFKFGTRSSPSIKEETKGGTLKITKVDEENKIVEGEFELEVHQIDPSKEKDNILKIIKITEGKLRLKYLEAKEEVDEF